MAANETARTLYALEMKAAATASTNTDRWHHLERAHILSQPYAWLHTKNHAAMLTVAVREHDRRESWGQLIRIVVAAPGSWSKRYPVGNTGRVDAGLTVPMPIPPDLAAAVHPGDR
ncbi:DUF3703 domain-containing protein [Rhodococcus sp. BP-252]|uniref:DUF3703 domain-containing protein n=1 Tax=Rhodococcoides kyotonense TaxID=398843 RepID=A0A177YLJ9_9NOCA|nr:MULTISPECIES: DUF3703 domain-containing protein [Rhodococcus]MBY6413953.1 DUF3703 domain-containing protein [Rhodococcus sp. BP-320]MBY6418597.1 DUF3703 domain-containing protein [Rhodococcus sp. BP-321]MBY6422892.1 DUF3703 domain-containing protein [Rhodococcus sp. BP-324]MBY6428759.1 DUF3703 domain-containing protein [Rhodococcus sp. BP-323]MBY6433718.1 DUF3703 domain-containing protein [Rhodococcus sp. BP-322]